MPSKPSAPERLPKLEIVPLSVRKANEFVVQFHRHHGPRKFARFALGVRTVHDKQLHGVAIVAHPVTQARDDGWSLELARLCTDGTPNCCSALLSACWRATKALAYKRLGTYILASEPGTSLKAAGWELKYVSPGGDWRKHPRAGQAKPLGPKQLWEPADSVKVEERRPA